VQADALPSSTLTHEKSGASRGVTACPACGGSTNVQVGQEATAFDSVVRGKAFHQPAYAIRSCEGCGLYFKSRTVTLESLTDYYARLECETFEHEGNFPTDHILQRTLECLPSGSKVLDFGCSTGRILKSQTGRLNCFGVEVNEAAAVIARERGIRIISEQQLRAGKPRDFDAILLTDVYEHLPRPVELVEMLVALIKPGGWLAIVTGCADAISTRDRIGEFWYFRLPGHLHMLSERHLDWLAASVGFRLDVLHRCSHYDTPLKDRLRQSAQSFAYSQFRRPPRRGLTALLRVVPLLNRAERWPSAPALTYAPDHVVAVLRKHPTQSI
jgi:SAM-dependent methyltransferase